MEIRDKRLILTGAAGGIGRRLAEALAARGGRMVLIDRERAALEEVAGATGGHAVAGDLSTVEGCTAAAEAALDHLGEVDLLINLAGLNSFRNFDAEEPAALERLIHVNLLAPMLLTRAVLPGMIARGSGRIVNVGSIFGSIGFAWFTAYSASKFGLRGFSEALRRELADTGVRVSYVAPRAVRTPMNDDAVMRMGAATGMNMDDPDVVAARIIEAIDDDHKDTYIGFPESLFVRVNVMLPRLVDRALAEQNRIARKFALRQYEEDSEG
ncbi:MAG: SDR family oxidoreductase [Zetaproteobacteria bacterium]|nr:MAG: SDR family oxidoreductase [Zetaproteobacteria bacterium]